MKKRSLSKQVWPVLLLVIIVMTLFFLKPARSAEIVDRIVAVVNGEIITLSELERASKSFYRTIKAQAMRTGKELPPLAELRRHVLDALIDKKLTEQEAERLKITVSDQDVDNSINRLLDDKGITMLQLIEGLKRDGKTIDELREEIRENIQRSRLLTREVKSKIVITDEEIKEFYQKYINKFSEKDKWHLRVILLPLSRDSSEQEKEKTMKLARKIKADLDKGASFAALAHQYSRGPGADEGGDLGYLHPGDLDPALGKFVSALPAGGITPPIETDDGIYIFMVEDIQSGESKSLDEAKNYIRHLLYQQEVNKRYDEWLKELKARSYIKINL